MKVKSIAECSPWNILQYFWPAISFNRSWKPFFCLFERLFYIGFNVYYPLWTMSMYVTPLWTLSMYVTPCELCLCMLPLVNFVNICYPLWTLSIYVTPCELCGYNWYSFACVFSIWLVVTPNISLDDRQRKIYNKRGGVRWWVLSSAFVVCWNVLEALVKQCQSRSDCSCRSSLIWVHTVYLYTYISQ